MKVERRLQKVEVDVSDDLGDLNLIKEQENAENIILGESTPTLRRSVPAK